MNIEELKKYAEGRGLKNVDVVNDPLFGTLLCGTGENSIGWPLVWDIAEECGVKIGIGDTDYHQINLNY